MHKLLAWVSWPRADEHRAFWPVAALLIVSALAQSVADVQSTALIADTSGTRGVLLLWALEALVTWFGITSVARWLDRVDPRRLARDVSLGLALAFALLALGARNWPASGWWMAVGVVNGLQADLLVLAAWTMARNALDEAQGMRLFGLLSALSYAGTVAGAGATALAAGRLAGWQLILATAGIVLAAAPIAAWLAPQSVLRTEADAQEADPSGSAVWRSPLFRRLGLLQLGNGAAWTALALTVVLTLQLDNQGDASLQRSYGWLKSVSPVLHALMQATLANRALSRLGYGRTLAFTPMWLLAGLALLVLWPSAPAAWLASLGLQLAFGLEGAALQVVVLRAAPAVRGSVGAALTAQLPQVGYLLGCALCVGVDAFIPAGQPLLVARTIAATGMLVALWSGWLVRRLPLDDSPTTDAAR